MEMAFDHVIKGVQWVLDNCTSYQVAKDLGINNRTVNRYQNGESPMENMAFGTAEKLYNYYLREMKNMKNMRYTVGAYKEYETQFGMIEQEQVKTEDAYDETQAEKIAKEIFNEGGYTAIYISYAHPTASCYYNPAAGHESTGKNWVKHFENMVDDNE